MTTLQENQIETAHTKPPVTIISNAMKFQPGQCVATPGALTLLDKTGFSAAFLINRHLHGDWGDICAEDAELNELALKDGSRIMSVYHLVSQETLEATPHSMRFDLSTIWIITDAAMDCAIPTLRQVTTFLLPSEY
jgi:hypothetical protein